MGYLIGIDIGTTGTKAILIEENGRVISTATEGYPLQRPHPQWAEQNPEDWWRATINSIKSILANSRVDPKDIKCVGLSGQYHGAVLIDKNFNVLRPCILWCDQRTESQCEYINQKIGAEQLMKIVCNSVSTAYIAPKLLWVRDNEPHIYEKIFKILLPKDYIRFKLTDVFATDVTDASGTLFFDVRERQWSKQVLEKLNIDQRLLPKCYESQEITGQITREAAMLTGLKPGTLVVGGAGDQAAQAVGVGIIEEGLISFSIGTSGVVSTSLDEPKYDPHGRLVTFCHAVPNKWHMMGVVQSAGESLQWFLNNLGVDEIDEARKQGVDPYEVLIQKASTVNAGSEGLIFLPYLNGVRHPYFDPNARAVWFGLTLRHNKAHMIRSVLEGVAYALKDCSEVMKELGVIFREIRISGGGAKSSFWKQIQADVNNVPIVTVNTAEGAAFGAALLAGVGAGVYNSVSEACNQTIRVIDSKRPNKNIVGVYRTCYKIYQTLYPALKDNFNWMSKTIVN